MELIAVAILGVVVSGQFAAIWYRIGKLETRVDRQNGIMERRKGED